MHRKAVFALAGVFLAIALIVPPAIFILQADHDLDNYIVVNDNPGLATSGNITTTDQMHETHQTNILIAAIIEAIFIVLFAVTLFFAINHIHPHPRSDNKLITG